MTPLYLDDLAPGQHFVGGTRLRVKDNGVGIAGIAPQARVLALRACWQAANEPTLCTGLGLEKRGVRATLQDERSRITFVMPGETRRYPKEDYFYFSAFPMEGRAEGVCEQGSYYELTDAELTAGYPLGVSNEYAEGSDCITVSTREGALVIVETVAD